MNAVDMQEFYRLLSLIVALYVGFAIYVVAAHFVRTANQLLALNVAAAVAVIAWCGWAMAIYFEATMRLGAS